MSPLFEGSKSALESQVCPWLEVCIGEGHGQRPFLALRCLGLRSVATMTDIKNKEGLRKAA
jgi:hypothetical protein